MIPGCCDKRIMPTPSGLGIKKTLRKLGDKEEIKEKWRVSR